MDENKRREEYDNELLDKIISISTDNSKIGVSYYDSLMEIIDKERKEAVREAMLKLWDEDGDNCIAKLIRKSNINKLLTEFKIENI